MGQNARAPGFSAGRRHHEARSGVHHLRGRDHGSGSDKRDLRLEPQAAGSVPLFSDMDATKNGADDLFITNPFGYGVGDLLVLVEPGTAKNCSIMEVSKINGNQITDRKST